MSKLFEYIISIKDKASAAAAKIDKAVGGLNEDMNKVVKAASSMQDKVASSFRNMASKVGQSMSQMSRNISNKVSGWRKDFMDSLPGSRLLKNPIALSGAAIGGFWASTLKAMDAGKEKLQMQVLTGSEQIGTSLFNGLTKFATDTVFGNEVYGFATQMLANGIKDADVMPIMKQLGDISMGDANKLGQLSLAFAQINGKGHLAGQELLQLINAGFNPLQVLSEKTGVSMNKLTDKMSKGEISVTDVRKAFTLATGPGGKFAGMLNKIANTPYGRLEQLKGQLDQMMVKIGNVFLPIASKLMDWLSKLNDVAGPYLKPLVVMIAALSAGILVAAAAQWVWNIALSANPIGLIIIAIAAMVAGIVYAYNKFQAFHDVVNTIGDVFKTVGLVLVSFYNFAIKPIIDAIDWALNKLDVFKSQTDIIADSMRKIPEAQRTPEMNAWLEKYDYEKAPKKVLTFIQPSDTIAPAKIPGLHGNTPGTGDKETKNSRESVATGGTKNTTIHIQIGKQIESLTVVSNNLKEGATKIRDIIVEEMTRAAAMAGALAG